MKNNFDNIDKFLTYIETEREVIKTGFNKLDNCLNGGLSSNLYILGAMSSVGKTTYSLQLADNIARDGKGVIIFSIEMTSNDLTAKSLSRLSTESNKDLTVNDILNKDNLEITKELLKQYEEIGNNIFLYENMKNTDEIEEVIKHYIEEKKETPVIIVDYLQILQCKNNLTDKQKNDYNISCLHRLSKVYQTPIWVISAINRSSYNNGVEMSSYKESGQIEYEADILMSLEKTGVSDVQLKILKNRYGVPDTTIDYRFTPQFNLFEEI